MISNNKQITKLTVRQLWIWGQWFITIVYHFLFTCFFFAILYSSNCLSIIAINGIFFCGHLDEISRYFIQTLLMGVSRRSYTRLAFSCINLVSTHCLIWMKHYMPSTNQHIFLSASYWCKLFKSPSCYHLSAIGITSKSLKSTSPIYLPPKQVNTVSFWNS